jgi:hypothetical protein
VNKSNRVQLNSLLRNLSDQYSQPENRATHAPMTAINEDRNLEQTVVQTAPR